MCLVAMTLDAAGLGAKRHIDEPQQTIDPIPVPRCMNCIDDRRRQEVNLAKAL